MTEFNTLVKVLGAFRITLPMKWREKYKIQEGDFLKVVGENGYLKIIPVIVTIKEKERAQ